MNGRYAGKRFAALLVSCGLLFAGLFVSIPETFGVFAQTLGILYGAYLAGQSTTDYVTAKNGN